MAELALNITARNQAQAALNSIGSGLGKIAAQAKTAQQSLAAMGQAMTGAGTALSVGVTAPILGFAAAAIKGAAEQEQLTIAFTTMLGSADKAKVLMTDLAEFAAATPFSQMEVVSAGKQLLAFGVAAEDVKPALTQLGDLAAGIGIPVGELTYLYGTAKAQGRLFMADINQFSGRGIPMIEALATTMGVAQSDVRKLVEEGKVGFPEMQAAIEHLTGAGSMFGGLMEEQSQSLSGLFSSLMDNVAMTMDAIGKQIIEGFNLKGALTEAIAWLAKIKDAVINFAKTNPQMFKMAATIAAVAAAIGPLLVGLGMITTWIAAALPALAAIGGAITAFLLSPLALVAAALATAFFFDVGGIRDRLSEIGAWFGRLVDVFQTGEFKRLGGLLVALGLGREQAFELGRAITGVVRAAQELGSKVFEAFSDIGGAIRDYFAGDISLGGLSKVVSEGIGDIGAAISDFFGSGVLGNLFDALNWSDFIQTLTWENFISVLSDWGAYISVLAWDAWLTVLDWANWLVPIAWDAILPTLTSWGEYINALDWTAIITTALDWAMWIPALNWALFVTIIDWGIYIASLAWDGFIQLLDWATVAGEGITWTDFVSALDWASYVASVTWESFITKLEWLGVIAKLTSWNEYITSIAWGDYISAIDWTAGVITALDWASYVFVLPWNAVVAVLDWATYVDSLDWSTTVSKLSDWGAYVVSLDWAGYITGALAWSSYVGVIAWGNFVSKLNWPDAVKNLTWDSYLEKIGWTSFVSSMSDWGAYIPVLSWSDFVTALTDWASWVTGLSWPDFVTAIDLPSFANPLTWASFITGIDLASYIPQFPGWDYFFGLFGGGGANPGATSSGSIGKNANGTDNWKGGWTWVGERGPELVNLPKGAQVLSNTDSKAMIGQLAVGTTSLGQAMQDVNRPSRGQLVAGELIPRLKETVLSQIVRPIEDGAKTLSKAVKDGAKELEDAMRTAARNTPGLFSTSEVTQEQMDLAKLGIPQTFADDWIRRLTDEVVNGVDWADADIKDAAMRAGIDPGLPAKVILDMVKAQWNDQSFFANADNLELVNMAAIQEQMRKDAAAKLGNENLLAFLGIPSDQVQAQGQALGTTLRAGISQSLSGTGGEGGGLGGTLVSDMTSGITPKTMLPVVTKMMSSISSAMSSDETDTGPLANFGVAFATLITAQLEKGNPFSATGSAILGKIVESWADLKAATTDLVKPIADAINAQLDTGGAIDMLKNTGARMVKIVFAGFDEEAMGLNWVGSVASAANNTTAAEIPGNANGTANWRGGLSWVGERGPELVNLPRGSQVFNNRQSLDLTSGGGGGMTIVINVSDTSLSDTRKLARELAYETAVEIRRKGLV